MKGLTALQYKNAMNLHFSDKTDYDFFTYNGKTKQTAETLAKSPYKWQYAGMENNAGSELLYLMYKIWKKNNFKYLNDKQVFKDARRYTLDARSLDRSHFINTVYINDLQHLKASYNNPVELFHTDDLYPNLFKEYDRKDISLETFLIICSFVKNVLNNECRDTVRWPNEQRLMSKIIPFITMLFDREECESLFVKHFLDR